MKLVRKGPCLEKIKNPTGFTLLETMIIIIILSLFVTAFMRYAQTKEMFDNKVKEYNSVESLATALADFAQKNGYYPVPADPSLPYSDANVFMPVSGAALPDPDNATQCPASGYGVGFLCRKRSGHASDSIYPVYRGAVPVTALGLPKEAGLDKYGNKYTYAVAATLTNPSKFKASGGGYLAIIDVMVPTLPWRLWDVQFFVISHGQNGIGAYNRNGQGQKLGNCNLATAENFNSNCTFWHNGYAGAVFDGLGTTQTQVKNMGGTVTSAGVYPAQYFDDVIAYRSTAQSGTWSSRLSNDVYFTSEKSVVVSDTSSTPSATLEVRNGNLQGNNLVAPRYCKGTISSNAIADTSCVKLSELNVDITNVANISGSNPTAKYYCPSNSPLVQVNTVTGDAGRKVKCEAYPVYAPVSGYSAIKECPNGIKGYDSSGNPKCL